MWNHNPRFTHRLIGALLACSLLAVGSRVAEAGTSIGSPFSDHMVIQAELPVRVWGGDTAGTEVIVTFAGHEAITTADADGYWEVELPAVSEVGPYELVVAGSDTITLTDVVAGDVWLCSGQSNMAWPVKNSDSARWAVREKANPNIRFLTMPNNSVDAPADEVDVSWELAGPDTVKDFSAVGHFFGRRLHMETGRPIGLIDASWGGSKIRAWVPEDSLRGHRLHEVLAQRSDEQVADFERRLADYRANGQKGQRPRPNGGGPQHKLSHLYNGMIHPLGNLPIRGVLWYQGESDAWMPDDYATLFDMLVAAWRDQFGDDELPVYFVQLPNFDNGNEDTWRRFREMQRLYVARPDDGIDMVVTIDVGDSKDIHPRKKKKVGERLAFLALRDVYGQDIQAGSPLPVSATVESDGAVRVTFENVGDGLKVRGNKDILAFVLVDDTGKGHIATAEIAGPDTVLVRAEGVEAPTIVRYAYRPDPKVNLVNAADEPVTPFSIELGE